MRHLCEWTILAENQWPSSGRKLTAPRSIAAVIVGPQRFRLTPPGCCSIPSYRSPI